MVCKVLEKIFTKPVKFIAIAHGRPKIMYWLGVAVMRDRPMTDQSGLQRLPLPLRPSPSLLTPSPLPTMRKIVSPSDCKNPAAIADNSKQNIIQLPRRNKTVSPREMKSTVLCSWCLRLCNWCKTGHVGHQIGVCNTFAKRSQLQETSCELHSTLPSLSRQVGSSRLQSGLQSPMHEFGAYHSKILQIVGVNFYHGDIQHCDPCERHW